MFHSSPVNRRQNLRHDSTVSASERQRIKDEAVRKIRERQAAAVRRRVATA